MLHVQQCTGQSATTQSNEAQSCQVEIPVEYKVELKGTSSDVMMATERKKRKKKKSLFSFNLDTTYLSVFGGMGLFRSINYRNEYEVTPCLSPN